MVSLNYEKAAWEKGFDLVAGVDEAGRGPLAGPVVAGAVVLKTIDFDERIDDSKKLTAKQRGRAFNEITKKAIIGTGVVDNYFIDKFNIANATIMAMQQALFNLFIRPDFLLIDGNLNLRVDIPSRYIISGDAKSLSIAAASIVAKVVRDNLMFTYHKQYPIYNFITNKGYGTKRHIYIMRRFGLCGIHRRSFKPFSNVMGH